MYRQEHLRLFCKGDLPLPDLVRVIVEVALLGSVIVTAGLVEAKAT